MSGPVFTGASHSTLRRWSNPDRYHRGRRRLPRGLGHVRDGDRHRDGGGAAFGVVGLDDDGVGGLASWL